MKQFLVNFINYFYDLYRYHIRMNKTQLRDYVYKTRYFEQKEVQK